MIPSKNDPAHTTGPYTCDCCAKDFWPSPGVILRALLVKVGDVTYFACSSSCGRTLFEIHHRYALAEIESVGPSGKS